MLDQITPLILTRDEESNIRRTLTQLSWARRVIVVDSDSTDATVAIARSFPNVVVVQRPLDTLAAQWTFALAQSVTEWVLTLDADYYVPDALTLEMDSLEPPAGVAGYEAAFRYAIEGKALRGTLYPPRIVLLRRVATTFWQDGHTQRVRAAGRVERLRTPITHDDRKPFSRFVSRQQRYMRDEARKLRSSRFADLGAAGRLRKLRVIAPLAVAFHALFVRGLILDGRAGWRYAWERVVAETILSRELFFPESESDS